MQIKTINLGRGAFGQPGVPFLLTRRAHYPRYSTIRGNFQIVAIYKDFKEISSDNLSLHDTVKVTKENRRL